MRMVELNNKKKNLSQMVLTHKDSDNEGKMDKLKYLMEKYWSTILVFKQVLQV